MDEQELAEDIDCDIQSRRIFVRCVSYGKSHYPENLVERSAVAPTESSLNGDSNALQQSTSVL